MPDVAKRTSSGVEPEVVIVHPLVLLSVVDHYQRAALAPGKRIVGILMGHWTGRTVHLTNSYALPFEENDQDPTVWYLDHNYHESMSELCKKINAKEKPLGWYHSGPKLRPSDLTIHELIGHHCPLTTCPILCVIDPNVHGTASPVQAYHVVSGATTGNSTEDPASRTFAHLPSTVEADESEAVGVEHLLRDVSLHSSGSLSDALGAKTHSLGALAEHLASIESYLAHVLTGTLPPRPAVLAAIQEMFNLLPDVHSETAQQALTATTNDQMAVIYGAALGRTTIAINELVANKLETLSA